MEIASIPVVIIAVWFLMEIYKKHIAKTEKALSLIPELSALLGVAFTVGLYYLAPKWVASEDLITAIIVGLTSGLSATGSHEVVKGFKKLAGIGE